MKILPVAPVAALLIGLAVSPVNADIPNTLKPRVDPKIEAVTAAELLRLINDIRTEAGIEKLSQGDGINDPAGAMYQVVIALAHLGRYQVALRYCAMPVADKSEPTGPTESVQLPAIDDLPMPEFEEPTPSTLLASADARTRIYQAAIYRKVVYGKRAEAYALVPLIQKPEERFTPLMWLAEAALRDGQRVEALGYLKDALKHGGSYTASHEWLGLLMARAGQRATAAKIFKARQTELGKRQPERERDPDNMPSGDPKEMFGEGWGGLCSAMWSAGFTTEAMALLKAHPQGYATVLQTVLTAKLTPQRQAALNTLRNLPEAVRGCDDYQYLAMLPASHGQLSPEVKKQIEWLEQDSTQQIIRWDKQKLEYNPERKAALVKVVAAWQHAEQPAKIDAFLKRPAFKSNDSQRAYIELCALQTNLLIDLYRLGGSQSWNTKAKLPIGRTRRFAQQIVACFNRLSYPEVATGDFARDSSGAVTFLVDMGDLSSAKAVVKAAEQVFERNWKAASASESKLGFVSGFSNMADCFQKIGDTASSKQWKTRFESLIRPTREAQTVYSPAYSSQYWRFSAFDKAQAASNSAASPHALKAALAYPVSTRHLSIVERVELLPSYASGLSDRGAHPSFYIRNSGFWEFIE